MSANEDVREQAAWALGNIAGDSVQCRDLVLQYGALPALLQVSQVRIKKLLNSFDFIDKICLFSLSRSKAA